MIFPSVTVVQAQNYVATTFTVLVVYLFRTYTKGTFICILESLVLKIQLHQGKDDSNASTCGFNIGKKAQNHKICYIDSFNLKQMIG